MENNTTVIMLTLLECYRDENKSELGGEEKKIIRKHEDWKREKERDKKARVNGGEQLHDNVRNNVRCNIFKEARWRLGTMLSNSNVRDVW